MKQAGFTAQYRNKDVIDTDALARALLSAGVLKPESKIVSCVDLTDWEHLGTETYCAVFKLEEDSGSAKGGSQTTTRTIVAKAMISLTASPTEQAVRWVTRARLLEQEGVRTGVYGCASGCVFQDYYPHSLPSIIRAETSHGGSSERHLRCWLSAAFGIALSIGKAGFAPTAILSSIRGDRESLAFTDLGEDLGGGRSEPSRAIVVSSQVLETELRHLAEDMAASDATDLRRLITEAKTAACGS